MFKRFDAAIVAAKHNMSNKAGETYVDSGVKILIAVVVGAILMTGLVALFNKTILPSAANKIKSLFDQANVTNGTWAGDTAAGTVTNG